MWIHSIQFILILISNLTLFVGFCYPQELAISDGPEPTIKKNSYEPSAPSVPNADWMDPFDMSLGNDNTYNKYKMPPNEELKVNPLSIGWKDSFNRPTQGEYSIFYQRFVNILLRAMALKDVSEIIGSKVVQLDLVITGRDLQILQDFGSIGAKSTSQEIVYETVNKIFIESQLRSTSYNFDFGFSKILQWLSNTSVKIISSPEWTIVTSMLSMLVAVLWLVFITRSYRLAFFCMFFMIFIAGFGFTWMRMYEEKEIERYYNRINHGNAPYHCQGKSLAWYETIYYFWLGENCLQFYKTRDVRPIVKISPTEVLSVTLSTMFIEPGQNIGKAYGSFISGVIKDVPWYIKPIAVPLAFLTPLLLTVLIIAFFFEYQFSFSITGIHFLPSWSRPQVRQSHEKYIEDLSFRGNKKKGVLDSVFTSCKKPVYVLMNMAAVKSVFSNFPDLDTAGDNDSDVASNSEKSKSQEAVQGSKNETAERECKTCKTRSKSINMSARGNIVKSSRSNFKNSGDSVVVSEGCGDQLSSTDLKHSGDPVAFPSCSDNHRSSNKLDCEKDVKKNLE